MYRNIAGPKTDVLKIFISEKSKTNKKTLSKLFGKVFFAYAV